MHSNGKFNIQHTLWKYLDTLTLLTLELGRALVYLSLYKIFMTNVTEKLPCWDTLNSFVSFIPIWTFQCLFFREWLFFFSMSGQFKPVGILQFYKPLRILQLLSIQFVGIPLHGLIKSHYLAEWDIGYWAGSLVCDIILHFHSHLWTVDSIISPAYCWWFHMAQIHI